MNAKDIIKELSDFKIEHDKDDYLSLSELTIEWCEKNNYDVDEIIDILSSSKEYKVLLKKNLILRKSIYIDGERVDVKTIANEW